MGLLTEGEPLSSEETTKISGYIREHGVTQFLNTWRRVKDIVNDELKYGDEIECGIYVVDENTKSVKLSVRSAELRKILEEKEQMMAHQTEGVTWHPEFGGWMIESTPRRPYSNYASDLLRVERNMILRRRRLLTVLEPNEIAPTVTCFPLLGVGDFIHNAIPFDSPHSKSIYIPDYIINPHPRFAALTRNILNRRGKKVDIQVPLFKDINTPEFKSIENNNSNGNEKVIIDNNIEQSNIENNQHKIEENTNIHMDCMAFGMGMCCLQVTFQARDVDESRYMYDQLAVLAPIMLAMTAATPIFKGRLSDVDARWDIIAQSVDDRTSAERGDLKIDDLCNVAVDDMAGAGIKRIYKSRYDSVSTYIYHCKGDPDCKRTFEVYNDIPCPIDENVKRRLRSEGIDENLAHHVAHLFTRDPLVVYKGVIELDDMTRTDHFENIQSTNWQTCRWKPPPPRTHPDDPHIGWRTEFRSMEVQFTDFENAAFTVFVVLVTRVLLAFDLALYIPLSKVDENMKRAQQKDSINNLKFYFRKHIAPPEIEDEVFLTISRTSSRETLEAFIQNDQSNSSPLKDSNSLNNSETPLKSNNTPLKSNDVSPIDSKSPADNKSPDCRRNLPKEDSYEEMTADEIFNGKDGGYYPGLIPLVYAYLDYINCDFETYRRVDQYLQFISKRAKGEICTPATWIRSFVTNHPSYKNDSIVSSEIAYDLLMKVKNIGEGKHSCPEILGDVMIERVRPQDAYGSVLAGKLSSEERSTLIQRLVQRAYVERNEFSPRGTERRVRCDSDLENHAGFAEFKEKMIRPVSSSSL